jgi:hypothetical protein
VPFPAEYTDDERAAMTAHFETARSIPAIGADGYYLHAGGLR